MRALERADAAGIATATFDSRDYAIREERDVALAEWLEEHGVELVVFAGYMHLFRKPFLDRFRGRIVNTHSAPLPEFPGAHPIEDVLAAGRRRDGSDGPLRRRGHRHRPGHPRRARPGAAPTTPSRRCVRASRRSSTGFCPRW